MELIRRRSLPGSLRYLNGIDWPEVPRGNLQGEAELIVKGLQMQLSLNQPRIVAEAQQGSVRDTSPISIRSTNCELPNFDINTPLTIVEPANPKTTDEHTLTPVAREQSISTVQPEVSAHSTTTDILLPIELKEGIDTADNSTLPLGARRDEDISSDIQQQNLFDSSAEVINHRSAEYSNQPRSYTRGVQDLEPRVSTLYSPTQPVVHRPSERRRFLKRVFLGNSQWPNTHLSLGVEYNQLGGNRCWKAIGPAKEVFDAIRLPIKRLLDARVDELEENDPVAGHMLVYEMYMIGKEEASARPTLLFSCENARMRRRAIKFMKESRMLKDHPMVKMAESSTPPLAAGRGRLTLLAANDTGDLWLSNIVNSVFERDSTTNSAPNTGRSSVVWIIGPVLGSVLGMATVLLVIYFTRSKHRREECELGASRARGGVKGVEFECLQTTTKKHPRSEIRCSIGRESWTGIYGVPLVSDSSAKRSTIGGIVYLRGKGYGLTVYHAYHDLSPEPLTRDSESSVERVYDSEFSFDSEEEALGEIDATDVVITSQGL